MHGLPSSWPPSTCYPSSIRDKREWTPPSLPKHPLFDIESGEKGNLFIPADIINQRDISACTPSTLYHDARTMYYVQCMSYIPAPTRRRLVV